MDATLRAQRRYKTGKIFRTVPTAIYKIRHARWWFMRGHRVLMLRACWLNGSFCLQSVDRVKCKAFCFPAVHKPTIIKAFARDAIYNKSARAVSDCIHPFSFLWQISLSYVLSYSINYFMSCIFQYLQMFIFACFRRYKVLLPNYYELVSLIKLTLTIADANNFSLRMVKCREINNQWVKDTILLKNKTLSTSTRVYLESNCKINY